MGLSDYSTEELQREVDRRKDTHAVVRSSSTIHGHREVRLHRTLSNIHVSVGERDRPSPLKVMLYPCDVRKLIRELERLLHVEV